jgi:hypothetical protein
MVLDQLVNIGRYDNCRLAWPNSSRWGKFVPDIVALDTITAEVLYIEVEHNTGKDDAYRIQKWRNFYPAAYRKIYIYCDRSSFLKNKLIGEVNQSLKHNQDSSYFQKISKM